MLGNAATMAAAQAKSRGKICVYLFLAQIVARAIS
jgi:hypothetical protein